MTTYTFRMSDDGKMPEGVRVTLARVFPSFASKKIRLTIIEAKERRSLDQNSYYWVAIVPAVRAARMEMGDALSLDAVHEDLLAQFAPTVHGKRADGTVYTRPMRSKEMTIEEMAQYITAITAFMAEFGFPIMDIHRGDYE